MEVPVGAGFQWHELGIYLAAVARTCRSWCRTWQGTVTLTSPLTAWRASCPFQLFQPRRHSHHLLDVASCYTAMPEILN